MRIVAWIEQGVQSFVVDRWQSEGIVHAFVSRDIDIQQPGFLTQLQSMDSLVKAGNPTLCLLSQVHGTEVVHVEEACSSNERLNNACGDAWIGRAASPIDALLGVKTADCVPLLLRDPGCGFVAAVHAGWRGAVGGILTEVIRLAGLKYGATPGRMELALGPGAKGCCYAVGEEVFDKFVERIAKLSPTSTSAHDKRHGRMYVDIESLLIAEGHSLGIQSTNICAAKLCTICDYRFFSVRREKELAGRQLSFIGGTAFGQKEE